MKPARLPGTSAHIRSSTEELNESYEVLGGLRKGPRRVTCPIDYCHCVYRRCRIEKIISLAWVSMGDETTPERLSAAKTRGMDEKLGIDRVRIRQGMGRSRARRFATVRGSGIVWSLHRRGEA